MSLTSNSSICGSTSASRAGSERVDHRFHVTACTLDALQAARATRLQGFIARAMSLATRMTVNGAQLMAGITGEVALARTCALTRLASECGRQLAGLAPHVRRQLVRLQIGRFGGPGPSARRAAPASSPATPVVWRHGRPSWRHTPPTGSAAPARCRTRTPASPRERRNTRYRRPAGRTSTSTSWSSWGSSWKPGSRVRRLAGMTVPTARFQQVAADVVGVGRRHRRRLVQRPVIGRFLAQGGADQAVLDHQRDQPGTEQDAQAGQDRLQDEGDTDLARQAVRHGVPVRALRL